MNLLYLIPGLRVLLGVLFIVAASLKLPNLKGFSVIVASYNLLPRRLVKIAAYTQPFVEFMVGWWILSGKYLRYSSIAGLILLLIADAFVIRGLMQKKKMENCGCYGTIIKSPLTWKKLVENIIWTLLAIILILGAEHAASLGYY